MKEKQTEWEKVMSIFSQLLSEYMKQKKIQTYRLAQYCGYDRGNMYKIINGKRNPPGKEFVEKVAGYMHLTPLEKTKLYEAYQISIVGYDIYYRRKAVLEFLTEVDAGRELDFALQPIRAEQGFEMEDKTFMLLEGRHAVRSALMYMTADETHQSEGHIRMLLQPETDFLASILAMCSNSGIQTRVDHIFCLDDTNKATGKDKNYNLTCLKNILPLYHYNYEYQTWYYYGYIPGQNQMFALFPYVVLTSGYACILTADLKKGYFTKEPEMLKMLSEIFENCHSHASRLASLADSANHAAEQMAFLSATFSERSTGYSLQMEPCFMPVLTKETLQKYVRKDLPGREIFLVQLQDYTRQLAKQKMIYICSMEGILRFLQNGRIPEIPDGLYEIPSVSDRIQIVKALLAPERATRLRILKNSIGNTETPVYLYITPKTGTLRLPLATDQMVNLQIQETGMLEAFYDFCENLDEEMFYSFEEAEQIVEEKMKAGDWKTE